MIQIACNPVVAQLRNAPDEVRLAVSELLTYYVEGYEHTDAFKTKRWDGRSTFYEWTRSLFPSGFVPSVQQFLMNQGYSVQIVKAKLPAPLGVKPTPERPIVDGFAPDPNYIYQFQVVDRLEKHGMMIARVATGGGKSRIGRLCIQRIMRKTLFMTTRKPLLYQFAEACAKTPCYALADPSPRSGISTSIIGDSQWDTSGLLVCGMVQTLAARLKEPSEFDRSAEAELQRIKRQETIDFLHTVEFVIGEEAHESGSNSYYDALKHCRKAHYRLALTATPMMREAESNMRLLGSFGPVRVEISEKQLIDCGILAKPIFKYVKTAAPPLLRKTSAYAKAVDLGIVRNLERNKAIAFEAIRASRWGLPVVILVGRRHHGEILKKMLKDAGIRVEFIFGDTSQEKRAATLDKLASGVLQVVIGSTILDVGVDVPSLGMVILAGGGKAEISLRQRIGRGLRAKKFGPNIAFIVDFRDEFNKHLKTHAYTRRAIVEATPGFAENILPDGADFDFAGLGFTRLVGAKAA